MTNSLTGNTVTKPNSSTFVDHKRSKLESNNLVEENLAKTVKHSAFTYKKMQPDVNPEHFKASTIYG